MAQVSIWIQVIGQSGPAKVLFDGNKDVFDFQSAIKTVMSPDFDDIHASRIVVKRADRDERLSADALLKDVLSGEQGKSAQTPLLVSTETRTGNVVKPEAGPFHGALFLP